MAKLLNWLKKKNENGTPTHKRGSFLFDWFPRRKKKTFWKKWLKKRISIFMCHLFAVMILMSRIKNKSHKTNVMPSFFFCINFISPWNHLRPIKLIYIFSESDSVARQEDDHQDGQCFVVSAIDFCLLNWIQHKVQNHPNIDSQRCFTTLHLCLLWFCRFSAYILLELHIK